MNYYIDTIEQVKGTEEGTINEYGGRTKIGASLHQAETQFYTKCANVANDMVEDGKNHYYMDIKIVNSEGKIEKKDTIGQYVEG